MKSIKNFNKFINESEESYKTGIIYFGLIVNSIIPRSAIIYNSISF